ncbi:MAG: glycosyltransferase [Candidatus Eisenbacteria bacterium]
MNVLFVAARFPFPPDRGDRISSHHFIRALSRQHRVTLAAFLDGTELPGVVDAMRPMCERIEAVRLPRSVSWRQALVGLASQQPSQVSYYHSPLMHERISALIAHHRPDAIVAHMFRVAPFVANLEHPVKVQFMGDSLALSLRRSVPFHPLWKRPAVAWEAHRVADFEPRIAASFRENWVLSDVDKHDLEVRGAPRVRMVRQGVDETLFDLELTTPPAPRVLFLGNLSVPHNIDAALRLVRKIWPRVRASRPDATLELAGADPTPALLALHGRDGISVPGALPDLRPVWRRASVMLAPLRFSAGIQNKILEAMAAGVPVVTTPAAAEAILAEHGKHLRVAVDDAGLAAATLEALEAGELDRPMRLAAREHVRTHFSWQALVLRLEELAIEPAPGSAEPRRSQGV